MATRKKSAAANVPATSLPPSAMLSRIGARVSEKSERRIKKFALDEGKTVQELIVTGLSRLLEERGLKPLDESK